MADESQMAMNFDVWCVYCQTDEPFLLNGIWLHSGGVRCMNPPKPELTPPDPVATAPGCVECKDERHADCESANLDGICCCGALDEPPITTINPHNPDYDKELIKRSSEKVATAIREEIFKGDPVTGDELKKQGIDAVMRRKLAQQYRERCIEALRTKPIGTEITAEDIAEIAGRPEDYGLNVNCMGGVTSGIASQGYLRFTGRMQKPKRKERHANELKVWRVISHTNGQGPTP